jgi:inorganic pyrophosphatase
MDLQQIPTGKNPPEDVFAIIETPQGVEMIKYELDKASGLMFVDRFMHTAMYYPANYGFIPHTLSGDGDPCDILVVSPAPVTPGAVIRCRPVGVLALTDEGGEDEKILAVPVDKLYPAYKDVKTYRDLPNILLDQIVHFFEHYKDLEAGKWVKLGGWQGPEEAHRLIREAMARDAKEAK